MGDRGRRHRGQSGQAIVLIALMFAVLCGMLALGIDVGRGYVTRRQVQNAADASASAAARTYQRNESAASPWVSAETAQLTQYAYNRGLTADASRCTTAFAAPASNSTFTSVCSFAEDSNQQLLLVDTNLSVPFATQLFQSIGRDVLSTFVIQVVGGGPTFEVDACGADWAALGGYASGPAGAAFTYPSRPSGWSGAWPPTSIPGCLGSTPTVVNPVVLSLNPSCGSGSDSMSITGTTGQSAVVGNTVSWGDLATVGGTVPVAGDTTWYCGTAPYPGPLKAYCYPSGAAPSGGACSGSDYLPDSPFQAQRPAGPTFPVAANNSTSQSLTALNVNFSPGIYSSALSIGAGAYQNECVFLPGGVYQFQNTFSQTTGIVSNELRPPDEPVPGTITSRAPTQFWNQNSAHCDGSFSVSGVTDPVGGLPLPVATGLAFRITSVRTDNGVTRESAPSMCKTISLSVPEAVQVSLSNVPGATDYYVYLSSTLFGTGGGSCSSPTSKFYYLADLPTPSLSLETNANTSGCPSTTAIATCSLGVTVGTVDLSTVNTIINSISLGNAKSLTSPYTVSELTTPAASGLADQDPAMGSDTANAGLCLGTSGTSPTNAVTCPNTNAQYSPASYRTPGAVQIQETQTGQCLSFAPAASGQVPGASPAPLPFLFSGYQYAWLLATHSPTSSATCSDYFEPVTGGRFIGHVYLPKSTGYVWGTVASPSASVWGIGSTAAYPTVLGTFTAYQVVIDGTKGVAVYFVPPPTNTYGYGVCLYC